MSEKLRSLLDLRVSVTGGVHFDLVKRVLRDIQRAGQEPEEIIHQISETVICLFCPTFMYLFPNAHKKKEGNLDRTYWSRACLAQLETL